MIKLVFLFKKKRFYCLRKFIFFKRESYLGYRKRRLFVELKEFGGVINIYVYCIDNFY